MFFHGFFQQYVSTQIMVQTTDTKLLRGSRRVDTSDKVIF